MDILDLLETIGQKVEDSEQGAARWDPRHLVALLTVVSRGLCRVFVSGSFQRSWICGLPVQQLGAFNPRQRLLDTPVTNFAFIEQGCRDNWRSLRLAESHIHPVLWQVTPLLAGWLCSENNPLFKSSLLSLDSIVVELGCGVSGLLAASVAPKIGHYIATDQEYVRRLFCENLEANVPKKTADPINPFGKKQKHQQGMRQSLRKKQAQRSVQCRDSNRTAGNIIFCSLDWELDDPTALKESVMSNATSFSQVVAKGPDDKTGAGQHGIDLGFDLLVGCDCIYNDALVPPFVRACADICGLRPPAPEPMTSEQPDRPKAPRATICIIAQQLRSPEVFEMWLQYALESFHVWRVNDEILGPGLGTKAGYVVHILLLRG
ncbi:hypothetical protein FQN57_005547 [Myotisia sp. PD_48]|nr:hypothetical protein FQN57_005547 [Myotisia sp. PD_48]